MAPTPEHPAVHAPSLARCVGDVEEFLSDRFGRSPHLWHGSGFDDLLSMADVDSQLTGAGLRRPAVRVVRDGDVIDPSEWTRTARTGAIRVDDLVHPGRLLGLFADGATIVLQSLQRWWPPLTRFCREIERALGHPAQANAYLTPSGAAGLTPHHDTHDVLVLQLHGTKQWTVGEPLVVDPLERHRSDHTEAAGQPTLFETQLAPGDCLYLPRGFIHSAATQHGASLHLTIGVLATTVHDVLRLLVDRAADEPAFRRTLVRSQSQSHETARSTFKRIVGEFSQWLDERELETDRDDRLLDMLIGPGRRPPLLDGQILDLVALDAIDDNTVVELRPHTLLRTRSTAHHVELDLGDRRLELPGRLDAAVSVLLDGAGHAVEELAQLLDEQSRLVLVRRLVREGVLRISDGA